MKTTMSGHRFGLGVAMATAVLLMVPLAAMQMTDDVVWSWFDFAVAGTLLLGTGLAYALITRMVGRERRFAVGFAVVTVLLLVWGELAVGVFGTPFAGS